MEDNRHLITISIRHLDGNNWIISIDGGNSYSVKGDIESVKKALRRIKAKDGENNGKCRSAKVGTYLSMISDQDNSEHKINVWKSKVPYTADQFRKLMEKRSYSDLIYLDGVSDNVEFYIGVYEEKGTLSKTQLDDLYENLEILWVNNMYKGIYNEGVSILNACGYKNKLDFMEKKIMNEIKLSKNYLIEGNIVSKGTVVQFKEAEADNGIAFLPTDVWEKAKEISDENERFEYVKKEVGDEFTDDEIKDFLNKYKSKLNKIRRIKRMTNNQLEDLETAIRETLKLEGLVDKNSIEDVVELAKGDKELLDAWEAVCNADEKSLEKKENHFWKVFDYICKPFKKKSA